MAAALVSFPSRRWKPWGLLGRGLRAGTCGENKLPGKIGSGRGRPAVAASDSEEVATVQTAVPRAAFRCHEACQAPPKHQRSFCTLNTA